MDLWDGVFAAGSTFVLFNLAVQYFRAGSSLPPVFYAYLGNFLVATTAELALMTLVSELMQIKTFKKDDLVMHHKIKRLAKSRRGGKEPLASLTRAFRHICHGERQREQRMTPRALGIYIVGGDLSVLVADRHQLVHLILADAELLRDILDVNPIGLVLTHLQVVLPWME